MSLVSYPKPKRAEPTSRNLMLTLLEMKRFQREIAKLSTHELARKLGLYFQEPNLNKTISDAELKDLFIKGSLDATQAFLVYNLFQERLVK
jgi:hypothetical protein